MRNSSYNLILILLKLCSHCDHALKICMWFGYNPQIIFCHFFLQFELSHFWTFFFFFFFFFFFDSVLRPFQAFSLISRRINR